MATLSSRSYLMLQIRLTRALSMRVDVVAQIDVCGAAKILAAIGVPSLCSGLQKKLIASSQLLVASYADRRSSSSICPPLPLPVKSVRPVTAARATPWTMKNLASGSSLKRSMPGRLATMPLRPASMPP